MANVCNTPVDIKGPADQIDQLSKHLDMAILIPAQAKGWLGNLYLEMGKCLIDVLSGSCGKCPGQIWHKNRTGKTVIHLEIECKWQPELSAVRDFVMKYAPDANIQFFAWEPQCGIYVTSHPDDAYVLMSVTDAAPKGLDMLCGCWEKAKLHKKLTAKTGVTSANVMDFAYLIPGVVLHPPIHVELTDCCH